MSSNTHLIPANKMNPLKWVVNYKFLQYCRGNVILQRGTPNETNSITQLKLAQELFDNDGHSGGSYYWTKEQAAKVEELGWEQWLKTKDANKGYQGIGVPLDVLLNEMKKQGVHVKKQV